MSKIANHFRDPLGLMLSILVALSLMGAWMYAKETPGIDYYLTWVAADVVGNDSPHNIYDPSSRFKLAVIYRNKADELKDAPRQKRAARHLQDYHLTATPFLYWFTGLLTTGDYETDLDNWHALSLFLLTVSILVTCRLLGFSTVTSMAFLLPVLAWFSPLHSDLRVANVNSLQLGWIGLVIWLSSRVPNKLNTFVVGLATGLLVMFKPNLAAVALLLAGGWGVRRQYSSLLFGLGGMTSAAVTSILVSSWWMGGVTAWSDWARVVGDLVETIAGKGAAGNYSIVSEFTSEFSSFNMLILVLSLCGLCLVLYWWGRKRNPDLTGELVHEDRDFLENTLLISIGCIITMLASGLVWIHYYLLTIPMFIFVFRPLQTTGKIRVLDVLMLRVLPAIALVCLLDTVINVLIGIDNLTYWRVATMTNILILFVIGLWQLGYGVRDQHNLQADW